MIKVEALLDFTLKKFDEIKNITRKNLKNNEKGKLFIGDIFECDEEMAKYLTGNNTQNKIVVRVIEVIPDKEEKQKEQEESQKENERNLEVKKPVKRRKRITKN